MEYTLNNNKLTNEVLINKLQNTLNRLINENDLDIKTTELLNELLETLKILGNCTNCKDNTGKWKNLGKLHKPINKIGKKGTYGIDELNNELFKINIILNKKVLCK